MNILDERKNAEINTNTCDLSKNLKVSLEPSSQHTYVPKEITTESMPKSKYSADSRLKKIRAAFQKKIMNKKPAELKTEKNVLVDCTEKTIGSVSVDEKRSKQISHDGVLEFERTNLGNFFSKLDVEILRDVYVSACVIDGIIDFRKGFWYGY